MPLVLAIQASLALGRGVGGCSSTAPNTSGQKCSHDPAILRSAKHTPKAAALRQTQRTIHPALPPATEPRPGGGRALPGNVVSEAWLAQLPAAREPRATTNPVTPRDTRSPALPEGIAVDMAENPQGGGAGCSQHPVPSVSHGSFPEYELPELHTRAFHVGAFGELWRGRLGARDLSLSEPQAAGQPADRGASDNSLEDAAVARDLGCSLEAAAELRVVCG